MSNFTKNKRRRLLLEMLEEYNRSENEFPVIDGKGKFKIPVLSKNGIVNSWEVLEDPPKKFKGLVLEINERGNVTVWRYFKKGHRKEVASQV